MRIAIILSLLAAVCPQAKAQVTFPSINTSPWLGQELLGRVEDKSINVNLVLDKDTQVYLEYGTTAGSYTSTTPTQTAQANTPLDIPLTNLQPNTRHYYRVQYAAPGSSAFTARPERTFITQRPKGAPFTFIMQADPHLDNNSSSTVYKLTMANELAEKPDFLIDLGDTMLTDKLDASGVPVNGGAKPTAQGILTRTQLHRSFYDLATHSIPLFTVLGNHEAEWGSNLNGTAANMAVWDSQYRNQYFPTPSPDSFFSGDTQTYDFDGQVCSPSSTSCGIGPRRSYYSWEWGDALFIVLDPFWNQTTDTNSTQAGNGKDCCQKNAGYWSLTLGSVQYNWLKQTLEKSTATYKFVFSHNMVGGVDPVANGVAQGPMRGGVEAAQYLEWGGYNLDGTWGFSTYRPNLPMPIHQLLVANRVTAYFHGHDHLYAHQQLDGIHYQEVPQPSATNGNLGTRATDYGYVQGTMLGGRGYIRVQVTPSAATVQYIETWLPTETQGGVKNAMVADSYTIPAHSATAVAPAITRIADAAGQTIGIAPNMWVEIDGSGLSTTTRTWQPSDFVNKQLPTQLDNVSVTVNGKAAYVYYISPTQINILTPPDALAGPASVRVTVNGVAGNPMTVPAQPIQPSFFVVQGGPYLAATHADGTLITAAAPAKPGEVVVLYGNGFGPVTQSGALAQQPAFTIGGLDAAVQYAGLTSPGLFQFNIVVPPGARDGDQPIRATYKGLATQLGTQLQIQH